MQKVQLYLITLMLINVQVINSLTVSPLSAPFNPGGTVLYINGNNFQSDTTKCQLIIPGIAAISIPDNIVYNDTFMTCTLIAITNPSHITSIIADGNKITLQVGDIGSSVQLTLFKLNDISITDMNPIWSYIENTTQVYLYGSQYINTGSITCNIPLHQPINGVFINSSCIMCTLPSYRVTSRIQVHVYLNGQSVSSITPFTDNVTMFTYYSTPPQVNRCVFTLSYTSLLLSFDREIEIGEENHFNTSIQPNCQLIFDNYSLGDILGREATCSWFNSQQRSILIHLPLNTNVFPGVKLTFNSFNIRTRYVAYSRHTSGNITIKSNIIQLIPVAIVEGPHAIPFCGNVTFSGLKSQYGGPSPLSYQWDISISDTPITSSGTNPLLMDDIDIPMGMTNQSTLTLPSSLFTEYNIYNVTLSVSNFLGHSDWTSIYLTKVSHPDSPIIQLIGARERTVSIDELLIIESQVLPNCGYINSTVLFHWDLYNNNTLIKRYNSPILQILPGTLLPNTTYILNLSLSSLLPTNANSNATMVIHTTIPTTIKSIIQGGDFITYNSNDVIPLNLWTSYSGLNITVHWYCLMEDNNDSCINEETNTSLSIPSNSINTYISKGGLSPAGRYIIRANIMYNDNNISLATQTINIVTNGDTVVYLYTPTEPVHIHNKLIITGLARSVTSGVIHWECVHVIGYAYISLDNVSITSTWINFTTELTSLHQEDQSLITNYTNPISLVVPQNTLLPNNKYRFRATLRNLNGDQKYAEINIQTSTPPTSGYIDINPLQGLPLMTHFKIHALKWTDDIGDMPLYYRYGYATTSNSTSSTVWLTGITEENSHVTLLPSIANYILIEIYDKFGTCNLARYPVKVNPLQNFINLTNIYNEVYNLIMNYKQWNEGLSNLIVVLNEINNRQEFSGTVFNEDYIGIFKQNSIKLVTNFLFSSPLPFTKASVKRVLTIFESCLQNNDIKLSFDTINLILTAMETIVTSNINNNWDPFSSNGLTPQEASIFMEIYDLLINRTASIYPIISNRIALINNTIYKSYNQVMANIGQGLCQYLGPNEKSILIGSVHFGTLKVHHLSIPPWNYNLSCASANNNCPFNNYDISPNVTFGQEIFNEYISKFCTRSEALGNFTQCQSVCIITMESLYDIYWSGSMFSHHIKSNRVRVDLISRDLNQRLVRPITTRFILVNETSLTGFIQCVHWNNVTEQWSSNDCHTNIVSSSIVECTCPLSREIAVIDRCPHGYYSPLCDKVCPQGLWGNQCSSVCQCNGRGECSHVDGSCDCQSGWRGTSCQSICDSSHWGKRCSEECLCQNGTCSPYDGSCDCNYGWNGTYCNQSCYGTGFYGKDCSNVCTCRSVDECDSITGNCTCQAGYTGQTCNDTCIEGYYGVECSSVCNCSYNGTLHCDSINGSCYCLEDWTGEYCEYEIIIYSPSPSMTPVDGQPIWLLPVVSGGPAVFLTAVVIIIIVAILVSLLVMKKKRKRKISPVTVKEGEEEKNELQITKSKSLVRMAKGSITQPEQVSKSGQTSPLGTFQEPDKMGSKLRWQIIQLSSTDNKEKEIKINNDSPLIEEDQELKITLDNSDESDEYEEVLFLKGVYLEITATLKELRNQFIDSKQLENDSLYFQFLLSDTPGDIINIDDEEDIQLNRFEKQSKTIYIQSIKRSDAVMELCVCGKFAELECTECKGKGYCSESCQQSDWLSHVKICRVVSARRREDKRKRKIQRREKRLAKLSRTGFTPNPDVCRCGKISEYECTNCGLQGYCSEKCQMKDWKYHRLYCEQQTH